MNKANSQTSSKLAEEIAAAAEDTSRFIERGHVLLRQLEKAGVLTDEVQDAKDKDAMTTNKAHPIEGKGVWQSGIPKGSMGLYPGHGTRNCMRGAVASRMAAANSGTSEGVKKAWESRKHGVKGGFHREGDVIYYSTGKHVYTTSPTSVPDIATGYHIGRWESSVDHWNHFADKLGKPKAPSSASNTSTLAAFTPSPMLSKFGTGKRQAVAMNAIDPKQIVAGTAHEMEHTSDPKAARKIAMDHLREDAEYYAKLRRCGL